MNLKLYDDGIRIGILQNKKGILNATNQRMMKLMGC